MKINVLVCDDEKGFLEIIKKEINSIAHKLNDEIDAYFFSNGIKTLNFILDNKESVDILFLDIDMPDVTGLKIAEKIRRTNNEIIIIFVTKNHLISRNNIILGGSEGAVSGKGLYF